MTSRTISPQRGRALYAAVGVLVLAGFAAVLVTTSTGNAETTPLPGQPAPPGYREAFIAAAASCTALTPARLAGQVMAESAFASTATSARGGEGVAGLTAEEWAMWRPTSTASRSDPAASIVALGHYLCDLVGQARVNDIGGDSWRLALAAFHSGMEAVKAAGGVPPAAEEYVTRVEGYAAWYALQEEFGGPSPAVAPPSTADTPTPASAPPTPHGTPHDALGAPAQSGAPATQPATKPTTRPVPPTSGSLPTSGSPPTKGPLWNEEFHGCLSADRAMDGTRLIMTGCDGSMVQYWQPAGDGTIRAAGLCMDAANAGTADFTPVQVAYCSGNPAQLFTLRADNHLYSPYANKCVNIHFEAGKGTSIVLFGCLNQPNQRFIFT